MRTLVLWMLFAGVLAARGYAADAALNPGQAEGPVGSETVWNGGDTFLGAVHGGCGNLSGPELGDCFLKVMKESGASPEAVAFARRMESEAWMHAFRDTGRVDVAYVTYPFRANENHGVLLVNGEPGLIDLDNAGSPLEELLEKDPVYSGLAKRFSGISLWPGDRYTRGFPVMESLPGGGQRFYAGYLLRNGCHACEEIGSAMVAFDFSAEGRFLGKRLMMVTDTTGKGYSDPAMPITTKPGGEISIVLDSNPTTGYGWSVEGNVDGGIVKMKGRDFRQPRTRLAGAGGADVFRFRAIVKGETVVFFRYARPWEKGVEPIRKAAFLIIVR